MNRASFQLEIFPNPEPGWQLLLPAGEVACRDGRGPYHNDPETVLSAYAAWGMPIDVDYHHQSLNATDKAGLVPSAGSVVELDNRQGEVWGRFDWTDAAKAAIESKEVKFLSPVFDYDDAFNILNLVSVGLTNLPNLYLNPLSVNTLGGAMDELVERLCYMLNLPVTSTTEEIIGHLQRLIDQLGQAPQAATAINQLGEILNLKGKPWLEITTAAHALLLPGKTVPIEEFNRVSHELDTLKLATNEAEVEKQVNAAKASGKLAPSMEEWARGYARQDMAGFKTWAANTLAVVKPGGIITDPLDPPANIPAGVANPEQYELHAKAKAYQAAHSCTFVEAVKAVQ